jgi:hypothetical protein
VRTPCSHIVVSLVAAMIGFGSVHANAEDPPPPVDAARLNERYAIKPGAETLLGDMLGKGETLAGGCTLTEAKLERTSVLPTYTCGDQQVVLQLVHPASAPSRAVRTNRFAVSVQSGTPPAGLVEAIADRIRAREATFEWAEVGDTRPPSETARTSGGWLLPLVGTAAAALLLLWALRRRQPQN